MAFLGVWRSALQRWRQRCTCPVPQSRLLHGSAAASRAAVPAGALEPREAMEYDVCIVGAGPAGLSAAIRLKQVLVQLPAT